MRSLLKPRGGQGANRASGEVLPKVRKSSLIPSIDGLRALSVLWMISFHILYFSGHWLQRDQYLLLIGTPLLAPFVQGHLGVDVFFVISGYLIARLLFTEQEASGTLRIGRFYLRRATRILPAYVVTLLLGWLILSEYSHSESAWANILFLNNFLPFDRQCMGWTWSLAVEEQFYVLFPLLLIGLRVAGLSGRAGFRVLMSLWGLAFVIRAGIILGSQGGGLEYPNPFHPSFDPETFRRYFDLVYDKPYGRYGAILSGVIVAHLERTETPLIWLDRHRHLARALLIGSLVVLCVFILWPGYIPPDRKPGPLSAPLMLITYRYVFAAFVSYVLLYILAQSRAGTPSRINRILGWRRWKPIAELSYGAYLLHPIIAVALWYKFQSPFLSMPKLAAIAGTTYLLTFVFAYGMYRAVEKPCRDWGRKRTGGRPSQLP